MKIIITNFIKKFSMNNGIYGISNNFFLAENEITRCLKKNIFISERLNKRNDLSPSI